MSTKDTTSQPQLFVVATPIGNLKDISQRALDTLSSVDIIFCEDTRVTRKLLSHFDTNTATDSYHAHSSDKKIEKAITLLKEGKDIAMVSDAGTPTISDPGARFVKMIRQKAPNTKVVAVPGPSAATAALSISGLPASNFLFLGFLPHKKGRQSLFEKMEASEYTVVFYESPHRILKTFTSLAEIIDDSREVVVAREMTKVHEEVVSGTATDVLKHYQAHEGKQRGEFVVMVEGR